MDGKDRGDKKKKTYGYVERSEEKRQAFQEALSVKLPDELVFLDETGIDDTEVYPYAYGIKGHRIYGMRKGNRNKRLSIISALRRKELIAPFVFEGCCTRKIFEVYLEKVLVPELKPGQTVILDNASFHKGGRVSALIQKAGCEILYLPPYSPDYNPIEHYWASIKHKIRNYLPGCNGDLFKAAFKTFQAS